MSSSTSYEKQYRAVVFLDDNRALACDVSYSISGISSGFEDYADSVVAELLTYFGLSDCAEVLSRDNLPQGYLTLEDFREMADTRLEQESEEAE